jgi:hypothetical protein
MMGADEAMVRALGGLAVVIGVGAIILALLYLAAQTRRGAAVARATAFHATAAELARFALALDSERSEVWKRGLESPETLDADRAAVFDALARGVLLLYESLFQQSRWGAPDPEMWAARRGELLEDILTRPGIQKYWEENSHAYASSFRAFVDETLKKQWRL